MDIQQNTLYLTTPGSYVSRDHLTLQVEVPADDSVPAEKRRLSIPIHHLESICIFGVSTISAPALDLCWDNGVAVHYLTEWGHLQARLTGVADTSILVRRTQFRAADDPSRCAAITRQIIAGKIHNARNSLLRAARETEVAEERQQIDAVTDRANRPSLALDLMEEFRPWLADRLAITLINRQQIGSDHFLEREGGAVEFTPVGRKAVIQAYQQRKQETLTHPVLEQNLRLAQLPFIQARILARHLRGDIPDYLPLIPK